MTLPLKRGVLAKLPRVPDTCTRASPVGLPRVTVNGMVRPWMTLFNEASKVINIPRTTNDPELSKGPERDPAAMVALTASIRVRDRAAESRTTRLPFSMTKRSS